MMTKQEIKHVNSKDIKIEDLTPVMQQYLEIKRSTPNVILLYRLGDFYETFFEDAIIMSKELEITLTAKDAGNIVGKVPLAGIPAKSLDTYLEKLVNKQYKVGICEQLEDSKEAKGLLKRGITRIITPGTLTESNLLKQNKNNYICATFENKEEKIFGLAYADISTGEFKITQAPLELILIELARISPTEIIAPGISQKVQPFQIVPEEKIDLPKEITDLYNCSKIPKSVFEETFAKNNLNAVFKTQTLEAFGYNNCKTGFRAASAILAYLWETIKDFFPKFDKITHYELSEYMLIDSNTRKNLELTETLRGQNKYGSLLWAIDQTKTNMGTRLLTNWICQPLKDSEQIIARQNVVRELIEESMLRVDIQNLLEKIYDIERLATRLSNNSATPRDFLGLKNSLFVLPEVFESTKKLKNNLFSEVEKYKDELTVFTNIIEDTISESPPLTLKEGGIIKSGVNGELDYLNDLLTGAKDWLLNFEETEKEKTGIKNLKVGYNKVFGYFIEVTNSYLNLIPQNYIRKQTLTGAERFITEELKKHEDEVLNAQSKARELEYRLYCDFKEYSKEFVTPIREIAKIIAKTDVLASFAQTAVENNYCLPEITNSTEFTVINARHAVLEKVLPFGTYVANDLELDTSNSEKTQFMILTGPNMAGKSTFMRQNALITILAQTGSCVPADFARIGIADKIFTRVGASDDLTLGQSTFMVEMVETGYILNSATEKSFILLDEIGRGTSTYDGVAIAWAVAEYIATRIKARTIFATHYHELNVMTQTFPQIKNYRITVSEENGEIEFLRKIVQGGTSKSYGIQVAKMAGVPKEVILRSQQLMNTMQKNFASNLSAKTKPNTVNENEPQLNLF